MLGKFTRKEFLEAIFSPYYRDHRGFVLVKTVKRGDQKVATRYFPNVEVLNKEVYGDDRDVFFGICPRERMRPEKEQVKFVLALWADMNIGREGQQKEEPILSRPDEAAKAIRDFPKPPSITVDSGHGLHLYWLLEKPVEVVSPSEIEKILERIQERLGCGKNSGLDALMRLPDTLNNKVFGQPQKCHTKFINTNFRYSLEEMDLSTKAFPGADLGLGDFGVRDSIRISGDRPSDQQADRGAEFDEQRFADTATEIKKASPETVDFRGFERDAPQPSYQSLETAPEFDSSMPTGRKVDQVTLQEPSSIRGTAEWWQTLGGPEALKRLRAEGKSVELALSGTDRVLQGNVAWIEGGWIGIREGEFQYAVPLGSIAYIRYRD